MFLFLFSEIVFLFSFCLTTNKTILNTFLFIFFSYSLNTLVFNTRITPHFLTLK